MWNASTGRARSGPADSPGRRRRRPPPPRSGPAWRSLLRKPLPPVALVLGAVALWVTPGAEAEPPSWEPRIEVLYSQGKFAEATALASQGTAGPGGGLARFWLARIAAAQADFEEAARQYARAAELGFRPARLAEPWSRALTRTGQRDEACRVLAEGSDDAPARGSLRYLAGTCLLGLDEPRQALPHLTAARAAGIVHLGATLALARAQFASGREDLAAHLLADASAGGSNPEALLAMGQELFRNVLYRQALEPFQKAWQSRPGWYDAGMYLALSHYQLGDHGDSLGILNRLDSPARPAEFRCLRGSVLAQTQAGPHAREELDACVELAPEKADGHLNLGLYLLDQGLVPEALAVLRDAAQADARGAKIFYRPHRRASCRDLALPVPVVEEASSMAPYLVALGDSLLAGQQWGAALLVYLASLSADPLAARPYAGIGLVCQELGAAETGLAFASRGVQLHPEDPDLRYYLGSLHEYLSEPGKAVESYREALTLAGDGPAAARYWLRLGKVQAETGNPLEAERAYRKALLLEPDLAEGHFRLGRLRLADKRYEEAELLLGEAIRLDPFLSEAYYSRGLALVRSGRPDEGRRILESHRSKMALRQPATGGMR